MVQKYTYTLHNDYFAKSGYNEIIMKKIVPLEKDIQLGICEYLEIKRHFFWRQNTVGMFDKGKDTFRSLPKYAKAGVPDIIVIRNGVFIGLEVKRPGGKQRPSQVEFQEGVERAGAKYFVVASITDVINIGL